MERNYNLNSTPSTEPPKRELASLYPADQESTIQGRTDSYHHMVFLNTFISFPARSNDERVLREQIIILFAQKLYSLEWLAFLKIEIEFQNKFNRAVKDCQTNASKKYHIIQLEINIPALTLR